MAKLAAYGVLGTNGKMSGDLVKAKCEICGQKYGSVEEARKCEAKHVEKCLRDNRGSQEVVGNIFDETGAAE